MEAKVDGNYAIFWVKLNGDLSFGNIAVTIKYGNLIAESTSNGDNTFIFFDDFKGPGLNMSKWSIHKQLNSSTVNVVSSGGNDYLRLGDGQSTGTFGHAVVGSAPTYNTFQNNAVEYRYSVCQTGISEVGFRGVFGNPGTGMKGRSDARTGVGGQSFLTPPYYGWAFLADAAADLDLPSAGIWYRGTITAYGPNLSLYRDGNLKRSSSLGNVNQIGEISLQNHFGEFTNYDWVAVRKFANGEPDIGPWDDETLPVELSSFTAVLSVHHKVVLTWITQSETGVMGFHIYRNTEADLANAQQITALIDATNTSEQQIYAHTDSEINQIGSYYYWLMVADMDGGESFHGPIHVIYESPEPGSPEIPTFTGLKQVFPNPFNPVANIAYVLAAPSDVSISIYNMRGQQVRNFQRNNVAAGSWNLTWDGKDQNGRELPSGVYYFRMQAGMDSFTKKAVLMK